ncbi:MAG: mechanosensitive ion channel family protein, partial [Bryobacteraceae bacterium]
MRLTWMESMDYRKKLVWLALLIASFASLATAQGLKTVFAATTPKARPAAAPKDPLGRQTPHSAISNFLDACHGNGFKRAAQYLDLSGIPKSQQAKEGPERAKTLCILINRDAQFELRHLSQAATGALEDGLQPGKDLLATFQLDNNPVSLYLQREDRNSMEIWLMSPDSVAHLPELVSLTKATAFEQWLPAPLVRIRFVGTSVWIWIVLIVTAFILGTLSRLLSRLVLAIVKPFATRKDKSSMLIHRLEAFIDPLRLIVAVILFRIAMNFITPSVRLRQYLLYMLTLLFVIGAASVVMRAVDVVGDRVMSRLDPKQRALSYGVFRLSERFIKVCIFCVAGLFLLHQWGFEIGAILAGLGVGGLAVALAAQKTLENLFGGISVISDRSAVVGDFYLFSGPRGIMVGTVEEIGLRSTRIRTLFRTIVTIPNASFAQMQLENFTVRNMMWFNPTLHLRRDTPPAKVRAMMDAMVKILEDHPLVDPTDVPMRFSAIEDRGLKIDIFSYVTTDDYNKFLNVQSELFLKFLEAGEQLGVGFAVPFQEITPGKKWAEEAESFFPRMAAGGNGVKAERD